MNVAEWLAATARLRPDSPALLTGFDLDADYATFARRAASIGAALAHPIRLDRENFGGGSMSEVEYDHHAFSWFADTALAAFPIDSYDTDPYSDSGEQYGFVGLRVTPGSDDPLGRVARPATDGQVRRTLEIDGRLYAVGANAVGAYDPVTLANLGMLIENTRTNSLRNNTMVGAAVGFIEEQIAAGTFEGGIAHCHATTRKGKACQRTPLPERDYCPSHQHLERTKVAA